MALDQTALEITLMKLAGQAALSSATTLGPDYPDSWVTLAYVNGPTSIPAAPASQGFLAKGRVDPHDEESLVAVLALGIDWANLISSYRNTGIPQQLLSPSITGAPVNGALIDALYMVAYTQVRPAIWNVLAQFLGDLPLYICGMGPGAPLAQLAALDLRPSLTHKGPGGESPPTVQPPCFVFSAPNVSNSTTVAYYNKTVVNTDESIATNTYWAGSPILTVDFLPTAPNDADHGPLGNTISIPDITLPKTDVPWVERGNVYYTEQLGGFVFPGPFVKAAFINPPAGFDQALAHTFALLVATAYRAAQHPGTSGQEVPSYTLTQIINSNGSPFACLFVSASSVVVAFRGTITWEEAQNILASSLQIPSDIIPDGLVHNGINTLYTESTTETDGTTLFRDALKQAVQGALGNKKLYLTGHCLGGALANLAAADYAMSGIAVEKVYTFGSACLGNQGFADGFNDKLAGKCYQVRRVYDTISKALNGPPALYAFLSQGVVLNGLLSVEENTYHSLDGYIQLLNPSTDNKTAGPQKTVAKNPTGVYRHYSRI